MPKLLEWHGHRFHFYAGDRPEPPHVHIVKGDREAKIWLGSLDVAFNRGYAERELRQMIEKTAEQREAFTEAWNEFFGF